MINLTIFILGIEIIAISMDMDSSIDFAANHPYLFALIDHNTNVVTFLGRVLTF
jgi:serine protease inhibitor